MTISLEKIRKGVMGEGTLISTPFGHKPLVYADYTASGRSLDFVEDAIQAHVLPCYANTHSESSFTGKQSSHFRDEARAVIAKAINTGDKHKIIFSGSGATSAINKLIDMLNLRITADLDAQYQFSEQIKTTDRPVIFIGAYEHHSNELPWRESIAELVVIPLDSEGHLDQGYLESQLIKYQEHSLLLGSFSAASNVTGIKSNVSDISKLLHKYNALSCWDYAAAAPYVAIDMQADALDAVFISTHKFIGGPGTPGILAVNSDILSNSVPALPGGGTVVYVTPEGHTFSQDVERREEGGTPAIVESIRAGLVFQIQQTIGTNVIQTREHHYISKAIEMLSKVGNFDILGSKTADRLSILSFNIKHQDKVLHYGFVVALLNDLFGIQSRGGCSCAGPYGHHLLALSAHQSKAIEEQLYQGNMVLRPGWVRLNFNYFIDQNTFDYLIGALRLVAKYGWKLLSHYRFNMENGTWQYDSPKASSHQEVIKSLSSLFDSNQNTESIVVESSDYQQYFIEAEQLLMSIDVGKEGAALELTEQAEALRWFAVN